MYHSITQAQTQPSTYAQRATLNEMKINLICLSHGLIVSNTNQSGHEAFDMQWKWTRYNPKEADIVIDLPSDKSWEQIALTHSLSVPNDEAMMPS